MDNCGQQCDIYHIKRGKLWLTTRKVYSKTQNTLWELMVKYYGHFKQCTKKIEPEDIIFVCNKG